MYSCYSIPVCLFQLCYHTCTPSAIPSCLAYLESLASPKEPSRAHLPVSLDSFPKLSRLPVLLS